MSKTITTQKKLLKTGRYTYMLTLPKEWVKALGWRAKQKVELELKENKIVIKDFLNEPSGGEA